MNTHQMKGASDSHLLHWRYFCSLSSSSHRWLGTESIDLPTCRYNCFPAPLTLSRVHSCSPIIQDPLLYCQPVWVPLGGGQSGQGSPTLFVGRSHDWIFQGSRSWGRSSPSLSEFLVVLEGSGEAGEFRLETKWDVPTERPSQIITSVYEKTISTKKIGNGKIAHQCCIRRTSCGWRTVPQIPTRQWSGMCVSKWQIGGGLACIVLSQK